MVEEYLSDREQEEALRSWWNDNWRWVISGVVLGLLMLGGWQYWRQQTQLRAEAAAQAFGDLTAALAGGDKDKIEKLVNDIDAAHGKSPYAVQAHLVLAQSKVAAGQFEQAANELKVVLEKSKDDALVQVARLRLARVQLQLGRPDEALALLDVTKAGAFAGQVHEVRGDALLAKGDRSGARLAYQTALNESTGQEQSPAENELLRLKLQDLSDVAAAAAEGNVPAPVAATTPVESK
jgi:predicted negative regulator of RcsB-dependent stress response